MDSAPYKESTAPQAASQKVLAVFVEESEPRVTLNTSTIGVDQSKTSNLSGTLKSIIISVFAVIIVVVLVCLIALKKYYMEGTAVTSFEPVSEEPDYGVPLENDSHIRTRDWWGGRPILDGYQGRTLVHPIKLVIIGHTASSQCMTVKSCATKLQLIQSTHVSENDWLDIGYNFLVGGDGNIYQALGWDIRNYLKNNSIQIQFIGSYTRDEVLDTQRMGVKALLDHGVKLGKLDEDYWLVAHSQVANTKSPGQNLLAEIKLWPHYYNGTLT